MMRCILSARGFYYTRLTFPPSSVSTSSVFRLDEVAGKDIKDFETEKIKINHEKKKKKRGEK